MAGPDRLGAGRRRGGSGSGKPAQQQGQQSQNGKPVSGNREGASFAPKAKPEAKPDEKKCVRGLFRSRNCDKSETAAPPEAASAS